MRTSINTLAKTHSEPKVNVSIFMEFKDNLLAVIFKGDLKFNFFLLICFGHMLG